MRKIRHLDVLRLRHLFRYDVDSGILFWVAGQRAGREAGTLVSTGHKTVWFDGHGVGVHRIAWALATGEYPNVEIDHVNGDGADNRLCNLRLATSSQNNQNRRLGARNKTGVKGVFRVKAKLKPWRVSIGTPRGYYITHFATFEEATAHAAAKRAELHGEFARAA